MPRKMVEVFATLTLFVLISCGKTSVDPPQVAIDEIRVHGVTLSPIHKNVWTKSPVVHEADPDGSNAYVLITSFDTYFSPDVDYEIQHAIYDSSKTYEYKYSVEVDGIYSVIESAEPDYSEDRKINEYYGEVSIVNSPREFLIHGDYILGNIFASVPVRATHIELWLNDNDTSDTKLVRRVALEYLFAYRYYVKPRIEGE